MFQQFCMTRRQNICIYCVITVTLPTVQACTNMSMPTRSKYRRHEVTRCVRILVATYIYNIQDVLDFNKYIQLERIPVLSCPSYKIM